MPITKLLVRMAVVIGLALAAPSSASGAVTLGSTFTANVVCPESGTMVQASASGNPYEAPGVGVITSWAHHAGANPPPLRFKVVRPLGGNVFALVGESVLTRQTALVLNEFPTRIPVQKGDTIGLFLGGKNYTYYNCVGPTGLAADFFYYVIGEVPGGDTAYTSGKGPELKIDVSAQFEPDADGDGFGDETQDRCPTNAATIGTCPLQIPTPPIPPAIADTDPPETTLTKRPSNKTDKTTVEFKISSDEPGSTFKCKLDKQPWRRCSSPKKVKRLAEGKHRFAVRATDPAGNSDPTPTVDTFKVVG
jgi:hypothetical protein